MKAQKFQNGTKEGLPPILIYFKFRGQLQPIRNLLCYLDVSFVQVHPEFLEEERVTLPPKVMEQLRGAKIDKNRLPLLVFQGYSVYQPYAILSFLCRRFQREDLLGTTPQQKARLMQILDIYFMRQPQCMNELSRLSDLAASTGVERMQAELKKSFEGVMNRSGYIREICEYLDVQLNPRYILASRITIADFLFLETCNYTLGLFDNVDNYSVDNGKEKEVQGGRETFGNRENEIVTSFEEAYQTGRKPNPYYLKILRDFRLRMQSHAFYQKHAEFLESFSIISTFTSHQRAQGLRKIWQLNDFFVK